MPVRRWRAEQLELVPADGGAPIILFTEDREPGELTTQDVFQVSPDGAYIAYAANGALHIRATDGSERTLPDYARYAHMRFSPDGAYLTAIVGEPLGEHPQRVILFDLASGATRELATFASAQSLEWMRDGVVVQAWDSARQHELLVALPLTGKQTILLERPSNDISRFVAAATGTRVVAFVSGATATRVLSFDAAAPAEPVELGVVHDPVTNAAASLDGDHIAFTTSAALFTITGSEHPRAISDRFFIHSLWFAHDGRLGYASTSSATILDSAGAHRFDSDGPISMLRFGPQSSRALVATTEHVWDVAAAKPHRLATVPPDRQVLGVDQSSAGLVMWTTRR